MGLGEQGDEEMTKRPSVMSMDELMKPGEPEPEPAAEPEATPQAPPRQLNRKPTPETFRTSVYFHRPVHDVLREIAYVERKTISDLINEGLDKVLRSRGKPSLKELRKKDKA